MTRAEIFDLINRTENFTEWHRDELLALYRTIVADGNPLLIGLCLHLAYLKGRERSYRAMKGKAIVGEEWCQDLRAAAMALIVDVKPTQTEATE